jgi:outer membrane protein
MRFEKVMVVLALAALLAWGLGAKNDRTKVGVFDADRAVSSTKEGRAAREELDRKVRAAQAQLAPLGERFEEMRKELEAKKFVLSEEARYQKQLDLAELRNQIENKQKEMEGQLKVDHERLLAPLRQQLTEIVEEFGRDEGFSIILLRNTPYVAYAREALDITDQIIERIDKKG